MNRIPVIIDCDPGYDDALALVLALGSNALDVKAITTTAGNVTLERTYKNAIRICNFLKKDVPISKGANEPILKKLETSPDVHSESGLKGGNIPEDVPMPELINTIDLIKEVLENSNEKIRIIPMGPLTNIAILLLAYPNLKEKIHSITLMGGAARGGNATANAEFNIYADAEAANIVFNSGIPIVMAGLDVTNDFQIYATEFDEYRNLGRVGNFVYDILYNYNLFYQTLGEDFLGPAIHDMLPVAYVINPDLFEGKEYHVDVEYMNEKEVGKTIVDFTETLEPRNVKVLFECKRGEVIALFKESISNLEKSI